MADPGILARHGHRLQLPRTRRAVALGEGGTPLVSAEPLLARSGFQGELFLKIEGGNPTGSFKDRGMTAAISVAMEQGARGVICASTGNTAASAAAYAARAGIPCFVVVPVGKTARGKLVQIVAHGAHLIAIDGNFDEALRLIRELAPERDLLIVNSTNPHRIEGQATVAFEVFDQLGGRVPEYHALPVGNGGNITAHWLGYTRLFEGSWASRRPCMLGFQAEGAAPLATGKPCRDPRTVATAIRIGDPVRAREALAARDESRGVIRALSDARILEVQRKLARDLGVFCEPASAASVAGVLEMLDRGELEPKSTIVCTLTGHGLKDPEVILGGAGLGAAVEARREAVLEVLDAGLCGDDLT